MGHYDEYYEHDRNKFALQGAERRSMQRLKDIANLENQYHLVASAPPGEFREAKLYMLKHKINVAKSDMYDLQEGIKQ